MYPGGWDKKGGGGPNPVFPICFFFLGFSLFHERSGLRGVRIRWVSYLCMYVRMYVCCMYVCIGIAEISLVASVGVRACVVWHVGPASSFLFLFHFSFSC